MIGKIFKPFSRVVNSIQTSLTIFIRSMYLIAIVLVAIVCSGCTGIITGHEYSKKDLVPVYLVIKSGVKTFMTREQIEEANLKKLDIVITDTYKLIEPTEVPLLQPVSKDKI